MSRPLLVVVTGLPCTGKTTLGRRLAADLRLPFINKDGIKETLFEALGWDDRAWSRRLGGASLAVLFHVADALLRAGSSVVLESNFRAEFESGKVRDLITRYHAVPCQVICWADGQVLRQRYRQRAASGERHPGHVDQVCYEELHEVLGKGRCDPLDIDAPLFEVDTTDFAAVDYAGLRQWIASIGA